MRKLKANVNSEKYWSGTFKTALKNNVSKSENYKGNTYHSSFFWLSPDKKK